MLLSHCTTFPFIFLYLFVYDIIFVYLVSVTAEAAAEVRSWWARYVRARYAIFQARNKIIAVICTSAYIVVTRFETHRVHAAAATHIPS